MLWISLGAGGLRISLFVSRMHMSFPARSFSTRGIKKGDGGPSPSQQRAANFLAAYVFSRLFCRDLHRRVRTGDHGYESTALEAGLERDLAGAKSKEGMVLAHADAFARIELGAALTNDHVAAGDLFAAE